MTLIGVTGTPSARWFR